MKVKTKKNAKIFGHIKKKQYLCTRFRPKSILLLLPTEASFPEMRGHFRVLSSSGLGQRPLTP